MFLLCSDVVVVRSVRFCCGSGAPRACGCELGHAKPPVCMSLPHLQGVVLACSYVVVLRSGVFRCVSVPLWLWRSSRPSGCVVSPRLGPAAYQFA